MYNTLDETFFFFFSSFPPITCFPNLHVVHCLSFGSSWESFFFSFPSTRMSDQIISKTSGKLSIGNMPVKCTRRNVLKQKLMWPCSLRGRWWNKLIPYRDAWALEVLLYFELFDLWLLMYLMYENQNTNSNNILLIHHDAMFYLRLTSCTTPKGNLMAFCVAFLLWICMEFYLYRLKQAFMCNDEKIAF